SDISPIKKTPVQIARVGIISKRVEQASASPASTSSANRIRTAAGTSRQSTSLGAAPKRLVDFVKLRITTNASVAMTVTANTAFATNGRRRKKLLNPAAP